MNRQANTTVRKDLHCFQCKGTIKCGERAYLKVGGYMKKWYCMACCAKPA